MDVERLTENDYERLGERLWLDIQPRPRMPAGLRYGPVIAEFSCAQDARLFASIKREAGEEVTITPAINAAYLFAVRAIVRTT